MNGRAGPPVRADIHAVRILVVDDEAPIRRLLQIGLIRQGYAVLSAETGAIGLERLAMRPDLVILDLDLPDVDGLEVLRTMRACGQDQPVIVLSARNGEEAMVRALDLGADFFMSKPFGMNELMARIRTALRHSLQSRGERQVFAVDSLSVDLVRRRAAVDGKAIVLSPKEFGLLRLFIRHADEPLSYEFILNELCNASTKQYLQYCIRNLRRKIEPEDARSPIIETIAGVGFRLRAAKREP